MPTQHTARRWMPKPGPARRDPPPTRRGEVQAALGKRAALGPHRGGQRTPRARAALAHTLWQVAPAATALHTSEGRRLGGPGTPRPPSQIAREGFLTEGASCPPHHRSPLRGPTGVGTLPKSGKSEGGGSAVWVKHTAHVSVHGQSREGKSLCCHQACLSDFATWVEGCHVRKARRGPPLHISRPTAVALTTTCSLPGQGRSMGRATQGPRAALTGTQ